eukprot:CAMPEP_0197527852 /NCGR_PEP_ID=MMETSP1318-20131121/22968_1 /TAXON_ID=552666 /ORGANISM="Partenskyella glossopodia, Strain RCC365" /LENGTH=331 /DNA_ID=CAMNT_0043082695 /DNA_START=98 /DNA_END=1093 /DNA_ORIENTATION=-
MVASIITILAFALVFVLSSESPVSSWNERQHSVVVHAPEVCEAGRDIVVGSRFWAKSAGDLQKLNSFIRNTERAVGDRLCALILAVNVLEDTQDTLKQLRDMGRAFPRLEAFGVSPWSITTPLNSILRRAQRKGAEFTLFLSVEVLIAEEHLNIMLDETKSSTLVTGMALGGHKDMATLPPIGRKPRCGEVRRSRIEGDLLPWNTLALWRTEMISKIGFLADADLQDPPGMEEAVPIAMLQGKLGKEGAQTKLIHLSAEYKPFWDVAFDTPERRAKQARKMASKKRRTEAQLKAAGGIQAEILHIYHCMYNNDGSSSLVSRRSRSTSGGVR